MPSADIEAGLAPGDMELERTKSSSFIADPLDAERPISLVEAHRGFPLLRHEQHVKIAEKGKSEVSRLCFSSSSKLI